MHTVQQKTEGTGRWRTGRSVRALIALLAGSAAVLAMTAAPASAASRADNIALLASANVGKHYCSTNTKGGKGFYTSCQGEYWCADFARWSWYQNGVPHAGDITPAAYSVYSYAKKYGTLHSTPAVGDLAIYSVHQGDRTADSGGIHHTAVVIGWSDHGKKVHTVSGDWENNPSGSGAAFWTKSTVVDNGEYTSSGYSSHMGYWIVGYVAPA